MTRWYRAYTGTVTDDKLAEAALVAECSRSIAIATWHAILESCANTQDGGRYDTTPRRVAAALGEPLKVIEAVFAGLTEVGMIADGVATGVVIGIDNRPRLAEWRLIRQRIFERDDFTCQYCGARGVALECDHIIPSSRGGSNGDDNLATACRACNRTKRNKTPDEWRGD